MDPEFWEEMKQRRTQQDNAITSPSNDSQTPKGKPLIGENEAVLGQSERFSFFDKGLSSALAIQTGTLEQFINQVRTNAAWKNHIEQVRRLSGEKQRKHRCQP